MAGETTPTGSTSTNVQPSAPPSTEQVASQSIQSNTDRLGQVDVQGLVDSVKASSPDVQTQRDVAAAAAKQIEDRGVRRELIKALEDQGVARKPGFWERQWQGVKGTATGVYEGGASLVEGVYDLGKLGVQGTVATAKFGYNYATDGQYRAQTNAAVGRAADATVNATKQGLTAAKDYAADRIADPSKLLDDAKTVDSAVRSGADAVAKKADQLYDSYEKARSEAVIQGTTDELGGKIVGRAAFEIGTAVVPVSKLGIVGKGASIAGDATAAVKTVDTGLDANRVAEGGKALTELADQALVRSGDDAARVARMEGVLRSPADLMGVERASPELLAAVGSRRSVVIAKPGSDELRMLDYFGAEASVGGINNSSIILRENPSKAAVLEEFLHGTQSRLGIVDRLGTSGLGSAETHVKDFMIRHQRMLGLGDADVNLLKTLRDKGL